MKRHPSKAEDYIPDTIRDYPDCKYREAEWVLTKMPQVPKYDNCDPDPQIPQSLTVKLKDLLAVQGYVNKPTVFYYLTKLRKGEEVELIRVKRYWLRGNVKWVVENGTHRVEAYRYLGQTEIPAIWGREE